MRCVLLLIFVALVGCQAEPAGGLPASSNDVAPSAKQGSPVAEKPRPQPSAAQIAAWEKYNERPAEPLVLVACYDGFDDAFIQCAAVSPTGKQFALGGAKLTLWNINDAKPVANLIEGLKEEQDIERPIRAVAFAPNGELLAAGDQRGTLRVWNAADQSERFAIRAHDARLTQLAISPDAKTIATTSYAGEVRLWSTADGAKLKAFKADEQEVYSLVFLTDTLLATAGRDATVWNTDSGDKVATLNTSRLLGPALAVSADRKSLAFADADGKIKFWDVEKQSISDSVLHGGAQRIAFSADGAWIATYAERTIRIFNTATQNIVQVIDADGDRTTGMQWLPGSDALLVASENGMVRLWSNRQTLLALGAPALERAPHVLFEQVRTFSSWENMHVIDVRSFPRLPNAVRTFAGDGMETYNAPASQTDAEMFYRWACEKSGWKEQAVDAAQPGLSFLKEGCSLHVSFNPAAPPTPSRDGDLQIGLRFSGQTDVRKIPKVSPIDSKSDWGSFASVSYRTKKSLTDAEIELLKVLNKDHWTPYSRLAASGNEDPNARHISFLRYGTLLTAFLGRPADAQDEVFIQLGVHPTTKVVPLPEGASWIEFDNSVELQLVANSPEELTPTIAFYDDRMRREGWRQRETGRKVDDEKRKAWLPYFRNQQDVLIRLVALPEGGTRVIVGDAERSSFQLAKPKEVDPDKKPAGIEAADFELPTGAAAVKYDVDQKRIDFELADSSPPKLVEWFVKQMESLEWKRDGVGVLSDEYSLVTFKQRYAEVQLRARAEKGKGTGSISGDGLLWTKPLSAASVRISYETWLRRNRKPASLQYLDAFAEEMRKIPADAGR